MKGSSHTFHHTTHSTPTPMTTQDSQTEINGVFNNTPTEVSYLTLYNFSLGLGFVLDTSLKLS